MSPKPHPKLQETRLPTARGEEHCNSENYCPWLCVITTRTPAGDIADHKRASALRRDLEQLSSDAGAKLLRALGVNGHESELRSQEKWMYKGSLSVFPITRNGLVLPGGDPYGTIQ
jgi:hypothetical protein